MFMFQPSGLDYDGFCSTSVDQRPYPFKAEVKENARQGDQSIQVVDAERFIGKRYLILIMPYNHAAQVDFMGDLSTRPHWERINEKGVTASEIHEIESINGDRITLKKPLLTAIKKVCGWYADPHQMIEECGFEDIHLSGNFQEAFVHHNNKIHDGGWKAIRMNHTYNSWVRRCRFTDVNGAVRLAGGLANTVLMNVIDGNQGHGSVSMTFGTRNFVGCWRDETNLGTWHGIDASHMEAGSVAWRIYAIQGRGMDLHSGYTRNTLYDCYQGYNITGHGGDYKVEPHHLKGFTLWNFKQHGPAEVQYDFWAMQPDSDNPESKYWGLAVAQPIVVGFHGAKSTFVEEHVGHLESLGQKVTPASLFEAQLTHRLGSRPLWLDAVLSEWKDWQEELRLTPQLKF